MRPIVSFEVLGHAATKGSAKAIRRGSFVRVVNDCQREKPWAQQVHWIALEHARAVGVERPWEGPIAVMLTFLMPRPGRLGKKRANVLSDKRPDVDKLTRSVLDALTGVFWLDDGQISSLRAEKRFADFGEAARLLVSVGRLEST